MGTEDRDENSPFVDSMGGKGARRFVLAEHMSAARAAARAGAAIDLAVEKMIARLKNAESRIFYVGAGTSGRQAVADGAELLSTFGWPLNRTLYCIAGWPDALHRSVEEAEDDVEIPLRAMRKCRVSGTDVVIAVAASGTTPFTLVALREAVVWGALTIGIANNHGSPILAESECPIFLDTGPELIVGSTRMKAGTAQRIVLNTLSTLVMIGLGYVFQGEMVNVRAKCTKIDARRVKMVMRITVCSEEKARTSLSEAGGDVRIAVMLIKGCDLQGAQFFLALAGGTLGSALALHELDQATR